MRSAGNKSAAVVPVKGCQRLGCSLSLLLFNHSCLTLMCTDNQSWEEGWSVCVGVTCFFPSPSLPPFCMWQFARWECNIPRGGSATVSGSRFCQFPVKIYSSIVVCSFAKESRGDLGEWGMCRASVVRGHHHRGPVFKEREWNATQTVIYLSTCKVRVRVSVLCT